MIYPVSVIVRVHAIGLMNAGVAVTAAVAADPVLELETVAGPGLSSLVTSRTT